MTKRTPAPDPFNNPFGKVKLDGPKKAEPARPPPPPKAKPPADDDEAALFLQAMGEVVRRHARLGRAREDVERAVGAQGLEAGDRVRSVHDEVRPTAELGGDRVGRGLRPARGGAGAGRE